MCNIKIFCCRNHPPEVANEEKVQDEEKDKDNIRYMNATLLTVTNKTLGGMRKSPCKLQVEIN